MTNASFDLERAPELIAATGAALGRPLEILDETASTNDVAKRAAKLGAPHGATWLAETQTAGRGRQGRVWLAQRGESLLFSVLARIVCPPSRLPLLALAAGLAVRDAVAKAAPRADVRVKWPNDVVCEGKKVAGILVESIGATGANAALVIGVGINVHSRTFPAEISPRATSVALLAHAPPERAQLLADVLAGLDKDLTLVAAKGLGLVHARLTKADALAGARVVTDAGMTGTARGIDTEGRLLVASEDGERTALVAGEVHLVG